MPAKRPAKPRKSLAWNAESIRALRDHLALTQQEMADELEVRQQTISEWETGRHEPHRPTQKILTMIAEQAGFVYGAPQPTEGDGASTPTAT
jgi:DNA-binding transcriptional regulator YiaG